MIPFITYREKDTDGNMQYYILQKAFPHFLGRIVYAPVEGALSNEPIAGYNMYVTFNGTIRGNIIPSYQHISNEISQVYFDMAQWFQAERIEVDKPRYKKFKIKSEDVSSPQ